MSTIIISRMFKCFLYFSDVLSTRQNTTEESIPQNTEAYDLAPFDIMTYETIPCDLNAYENDEISHNNKTTYEMPLRDTTDSPSNHATTYKTLSPEA